jgi:hypothetical protein
VRRKKGAGGNTLVTVDERRRELSITIGRIYGLYCIELAPTQLTETVLLKIYKATRQMNDILQPYRVKEDNIQYAFVPVSALHLSPSIASCPESGDLLVYGIH